MVRFFPGHDRPAGAGELDRYMIAAHNVTAGLPAPREEWMLDSGGFRILTDRGRYERAPAGYARFVQDCAEAVPGLVCAFQQDAPITPAVAEAVGAGYDRAGRRALRHKTIAKWRQADDTAERLGLEVPIAPVLHGRTQAEYLAMARRLAWTAEPSFLGIGGLKAPKADAGGEVPPPSWVRELVLQVRAALPEARLHALGIGKRYVLGKEAGPALRRALWSVDSSAWKVRARYTGADQNRTGFARQYAEAFSVPTPLFSQV